MSNNKQQTAVGWLIDQMFKQGYFDGIKPLSFTTLDHLQQQAKEMEKERLEKTWIEALDYGINNLKGLNNLSSKEAFDKYYEQIYGGNK